MKSSSGGGARWYWDRRYITEAEQYANQPPLPEDLLSEIEAALSRRFRSSVLTWSSVRLDQDQNEGVTSMSFVPLTTEVVARFVSHGGDHATLTCKHETSQRHLSILHESADVRAYEVQGVGITKPIAVTTGETLTFIARLHGRIVSTACYEVDCDSTDYGYILSPRGAYNFLLHQEGVLRVEELHHVEEEVQSC